MTRTYRLPDRLLLKDDGQDVLAFDPVHLIVFQFNSSLATVAKLLDGKSSCEQLVIDFAEQYGLELPDAAREVYRALKLLHDQDLLETK
jgi:hypothetical protein